MTKIIYDYFFTIELLHQYFADALCPDFDITPSFDTTKILRGNQMVAKQYNNKLYCGVQPDTDLKPAGNTRLTFFLKLRNPLFFNYTNLPFVYQPNTVYYFTNKYDNVREGRKLLHRDEYMSNADALVSRTFSSTYTFETERSSTNISIFGFDSSSKEYDLLLLAKSIHFNVLRNSFLLDLSDLPTGAYRMVIDGTEQLIYLNDEQQLLNAFAVVDIFSDAGIAADYKFYKPDNTLASPLYTISFLNRATIWKYNLVKLNPTYNFLDASITGDSPAHTFTKKTPNTIFSDQPIPLSQKSLALTLTINPADPTTKLIYNRIKCPTPSSLAKYNPDPPDAFSEIVYCSEIFINY